MDLNTAVTFNWMYKLSGAKQKSTANILLLQEQELMLEKLKADTNKIPAPTRDEIMDLFSSAWGTVTSSLDHEKNAKFNGLTIKLDGSEDHLMSSKLMDLVGKEMLDFRAQLLKSKPVSTMKALLNSLTPPAGVKRAHFKFPDGSLDDEVIMIRCCQLDIRQFAIINKYSKIILIRISSDAAFGVYFIQWKLLFASVPEFNSN